ncbi:MAG: hypothetical protein E2O29_01850 [Deltaproteobacteria bacterium]|nr:MAG: hypothetical protein E2O29_01850 [Deltaproteobacteria bacterium]
MSNREVRIETDYVHILLALARPTHGEKSQCIRTVDKGYGDEVDRLEAILKQKGGYWRIHRTVNARDVQKALKVLMAQLIYHPEMASYVDSQWRTALLQKECIYGQKQFMLDIDTEDKNKLYEISKRIPMGNLMKSHKSPSGWHYITIPFDSREVCKLDYVTLIRDGYYFIKEVGEKVKV